MIETAALNRYLSLAHSQNSDDRAEAARELKDFLRNDAASSTLAELLGDEDWRVRRAAVDSFLEARAHNAIPKILQALYADDNAGKRNAAIDILTRYGKDITPYLEPHLSTTNTDVRMFLINILGELRDDTFTEFITNSLTHGDQNIESAAVIALGKIGHPQSLQTILKFLNGNELWLTFQAIEAAGEMQDPELIASLVRLYDSYYFRKAVIKTLSRFHDVEAYRSLAGFLVSNEQLDPDALASLIDLYHAPQPTEIREEDQRSIRNELKRTLSPKSIQILIRELSTEGLGLKKNTLEVLGWAESAEAVPHLIAALRNPDLQEQAARALIFCDSKAITPLLESIQSEKNEEFTLLTLQILNELNTVVDFQRLQPFLKHQSPEVRYQVYRLIARSKSPGTTDLLIQGVLDPYQPVHETCLDPLLARCESSKTLLDEVAEKLQQKVESDAAHERGHSSELLVLARGEAAFPLLFRALKDEDAAVRQMAVRLMGTGYHHEFLRPLIAALADEDARVRELAATGLAAYPSPEATGALLANVRDDVVWVRNATYNSLSSVADERIASVFVKQFETEGPMGKSVLLSALKPFRIPATKELLLKNLSSEDPQIRKSACESLGGFNENDIVFHLFTMLQNDPDWGVRVSTIRALTHIKPFRLQQALLERLKVDSDPLVRKEILDSIQKLGIDYVPQEVYGFLLDRDLADSAYEFLDSVKSRLGRQIVEASRTQPPSIRRILNRIIA